MRPALLTGSLACVLYLTAPATAADPSQDSLRLGTLHEEALRTDPRHRQLQLLARQTDLRLRNLAAEYLPSLRGEARGQYQSDVVEIPFMLPGDQRAPQPPRETYDAYIDVEQRIFDPAFGPRRGVERARLAESQALVHATVFALHQEVNEAFFTAALLQQRAGEIAATIADLEARLREAAARVREGAALPGDAAAIEATLLQRRQDEAELHADRGAALAVLAELTGRSISDDVILALPDLAGSVSQARGSLDDLRERPEYERFARTRERLRREENVIGAEGQPRVAAIGRAGYGRPGLDFLSDRFDSYWRAGLQVQWTPWTWGTVNREREELAVERQIVTADEAAFTEGLRRAVKSDLAAIDRLETTLAMDDRIIALRERIERETRLRFQEGVVTAADYLDRNTDLLEARLDRAAHRVELAQASARFLTTLGMEVR